MQPETTGYRYSGRYLAMMEKEHTMQKVRLRASLGIVVMVALLAGLLRAPMKVSSQGFQPNACGDGRVDRILEDFESVSGFTVFKADPSIPDPALSIVPGCNGQALSFGYDLTNASQDGQSWIVLQKAIPVTDLSGYTHLRVALRSSNLNSHNHVEIKLSDGGPPHAALLRSMTDLPVWRPIYIDLREFSDFESLDLTRITSFEIAVVRCDGADCEVADVPGSPQPANERVGTLFVDELAAVNLKPGAPHRTVETAFETVSVNREVATQAAAAIYNQIRANGAAAGLVPTWFPEQTPNYNSYAQAEALLVFTYEYEQTGAEPYRAAARALARKLLSLQIPAGKVNAGAWYTAYAQDLQPPFRPLPPDPQQRCDGNETMVQDGQQLLANNLDACMWVGNVGWMLIALSELQRSGLYDDPAALSAAIQRGVAWISGQIGREPDYPGLIARGTEGNLSAYFGLLKAGKRIAARQMGDAMFNAAWDDTQRRMKPGVRPFDAATAMDVSGSWGVSFLRSIGRTQEALDSQGYTVSILRTSSFDGSVLGYGDIAGPYTAVVEFTAQAAVAGIKDADFVMQQLYPLQIADGPYAGAFPGATDHWYGGMLAPWSTTMTGVSPTAWMYFASSQIDPLAWSTVYLPLLAR